MTQRLANKVLLIGWDAADWRMIDPMLERGELPTLASLLHRGVRGNLATIRPMLSPMLWTSIATGKRADKHGILGFTEPKPDASGIRPVTSTSRRCKALWNIAAQSGLRSCVVNWFASHPAEPVPGTVITDLYAALVQPGVDRPRLPDGAAHPAALADPLSRLLVDPARLDESALLPFIPRAAEIDQSQDDRLVKLAVLLARTATIQAAACLAMRQTPWDLACLYFGGIDEFGHHFMPYHPPRLDGISERDAAIFGPVMQGCYRFHDMMLRTILEIAGPDTTILLVSDHGFHHDEHRPGAVGYDRPEEWHRPFGVAVLAGPGVGASDRLYGATVLDVTPTILHLLGLPIGADMDGRPWLEVLTAEEPAVRVISWDRIEGDAGLHPADAREDPAVAAQAVRHLADLGYVEPAGEDVQTQIDRTIDQQQTNLARALSDSRRAEQAVALWRRLAAAHPDETGYQYELAQCLARVRRDAEAIEALQPLGDLPPARLLQARILLDQDDAQAALAILESLEPAMGDNPALLTQLGRARMRLGRYEQAGDALRRAHEMDRQNPATSDALSELALQEQRYAEAVEHALEAVSLAHHFPRAHYHLGCALAGCGDAERAVLALRTCLALAPQHVGAKVKLADLLARSHEAAGLSLAAAAARHEPASLRQP